MVGVVGTATSGIRFSAPGASNDISGFDCNWVVGAFKRNSCAHLAHWLPFVSGMNERTAGAAMEVSSDV